MACTLGLFSKAWFRMDDHKIFYQAPLCFGSKESQRTPSVKCRLKAESSSDDNDDDDDYSDDSAEMSGIKELDSDQCLSHFFLINNYY
ncbi:hypothetical protein evm_000913 [Chilo suppressalis]|nr:hypothetical protein evm_000913 [Chilo suppressalis]